MSSQADNAAPVYNMFSGLPVPGGVSEQLWDDCQQEAQESLQHPFVLALAQGTLDRPCFQHYIAQDAHFLSHFAMAYAAAMDKCTAPEYNDALAVLSELLLRVHAELRMHGSYVAKWGVDMRAGFKPSAATRAYTDYLMEVAHDPETSIAEVLAAMIPCSRLYGYLGCQLAAANAAAGMPRHAYTEWIDVYSGAEYLASPVMKEELFDKICSSVPYDRLKHLYTRAMQLEVNFFSAQPGTPRPRDIGLLVCDFDDTITAQDTIGVLMNAAVEANVKASPAAGDALRQSLTAQVKQLSANYINKQQQHLATLLPQEDQSAAAATAIADSLRPYDAAGLSSFCDALSDFDEQMNQVVIDAGILKGLSRADISAAAKSIQLRPGCNHVLATAAAAGLPVAVLSVNWSRTLMQAVLNPAAAAADNGQQQQQQQQQQFEVHANELVFEDNGLSTGGLQREIQHGRDKGKVMEQLAQKHDSGSSSSSSSSSSSRGAVVYVGDSASDIPPLLKADYGIIIGENKLLRRVLAAYGVQLLPLCSAPLTPADDSSSSSSSSPVLYTADSWEQIAAFLFGPTPYDTSSSSRSNSPTTAGASASALPAQRGYSSWVPVHSGRGAAVVAAAAAAAAGEGAVCPPPVLTIAGSDSGGGAGVQADLKTILANGGFGMSALTALTAQNSTGVQAVHVPPQSFLEQQLDSVFTDLKPKAIKTGMLPDVATVHTVAKKLQQYGSEAGRVLPLVVDPVMISTSGHSLAEGSVGDAVKRWLVPLATVITPNLAEAELLWGAGHPIRSLDDMKAAAAALHKLGCQTVLIKGGHLALQKQQEQQSGAAAAAHVEAVDVLYDGHRYYYYSAPFIQTDNTHGTGCTLAAAIATALAHGQTPVEAVQSAKDYLTSVLAGSVGLGLGAGPQHPFHHGVGFSRPDALNPRQPGLELNPVPSPSWPQSPNGKHLNPKQKTADGLNPVDLRMYVVTDAHCNKKMGRTLLQAVQGAVAGGATVVQLREKEIDGGDFVKEARAVIQLCRPLGIPVIINDRVDVAIAAGADGVHVGQSDVPARLVRQMLGPDKILGVSTKSPAEAAKAAADGADYIGIGAVFPTSTKDSSVVGLEGLRESCAVGVPAVAIGGVGAHNAADVIATGVDGLAVVSAVFAAPDVEAATWGLRQAVDSALAERRGREEPQQTAAAVV